MTNVMSSLASNDNYDISTRFKKTVLKTMGSFCMLKFWEPADVHGGNLSVAQFTDYVKAVKENI